MFPSIGLSTLYAFVIVRFDRRDFVWINVTAYPTTDWVTRRNTEAFPWNEAPRYIIRDRDRLYGAVVARRLRAMRYPGQIYRTGITLAERLCRSDGSGVSVWITSLS